MYLQIATINAVISSCFSFANYNIFQNFFDTGTYGAIESKKPFFTTGEITTELRGGFSISGDTTIQNEQTTTDLITSRNTTLVDTIGKTAAKMTESQEVNKQTTDVTSSFVCPEEERPSNLGAYEVPTQRDLVVFTKKMLRRMFDNYHRKTMLFLRDIKEASRSTSDEEKKCPEVKRIFYRQCVRQVGSEFEQHTKKIVNSLEIRRHDVLSLTGNSICKMSDMNADPVQLMKTLAMEDVSLQYALPGFLRLLSACSSYCTKKKVAVKIPNTLNESDDIIAQMMTQKEYLRETQPKWSHYLLPKKYKF